MIGDYTEQQHKDITSRQRADRMALALTSYATLMHAAFEAERMHDDAGSATLLRADARAALHMHPQLLAMVEPPEPQPLQAITGLVERVGQWTSR